MLLNGFSIALLICSMGVVFVVLLAARTGFGVIRYWDHGADTARQIRLESEIWLSSSLMEYGFAFQILSLFLLVVAADSFSSLLVGAMCATGVFLANGYGIPSLLLKLLLIFLCGYWLVLHRLDLQSPSYPLVRLKYRYLFVLAPFLAVDALLQFFYLQQLVPDVLTSCCGVLFRQGQGDGYNLLGPLSAPVLIALFYALAAVLLVLGYSLQQQIRQRVAVAGWGVAAYALGWAFFCILSLVVITTVFSSYIYAMPSHRCPFDILQPEYNYIGYPIYLTLFGGTFSATACGVAQAVRTGAGLSEPVRRFQGLAIPASLLLLAIFILLTGYAPLGYFFAGGEF